MSDKFKIGEIVEVEFDYYDGLKNHNYNVPFVVTKINKDSISAVMISWGFNEPPGYLKQVIWDEEKLIIISKEEQQKHYDKNKRWISKEIENILNINKK